jgi:hypothetical protein
MSWEAYFSPCYLNVIDPINVAFGEGITLNVTHELYQVRDAHTHAPPHTHTHTHTHTHHRTTAHKHAHAHNTRAHKCSTTFLVSQLRAGLRALQVDALHRRLPVVATQGAELPRRPLLIFCIYYAKKGKITILFIFLLFIYWAV